MNFKVLLLATVVAGSLPILHLERNGGQYFDLPVELGSPPQSLHLRLDVVQGDVWVPDGSYFTPCNQMSSLETIESSTTETSSSSKSSTTTSTTTTTTHKDTTTTSTTLPQRVQATKEDDNSSTTSSDSQAATSTRTDSSYNETLSGETSTASPSNGCATGGVYIDYGSLYSAFVDIINKLEVAYAQATSYFEVYLSSITVSGIWFTDSMNMRVQHNNVTDDLKIWDVPFVVANSSNVVVGALALGYSQALGNTKTNYISNFVDNGLIKSNSYSLALSANNGTDPLLILGGVIGDLVSDEGLSQYDFVEILDESNDGATSNNAPAFPIFGWGVTSSSSGQSVTFSDSYNDRITVADYPKAALLDSRHAYNYIPYSTLVEMAIELNAYYLADLNVWITDCSIGDVGTIDIYLADEFSVKMPISNFIFPISVNGTGLIFESGDKACALAFLPDYLVGYSVMGTTFMKSAYIAVDNDNKQVAIGNLKNLVDNDDSDSDKEVTPVSKREIINDSTITAEPQNTMTIGNKDIIIGDQSSDDLIVSRSGRVYTVDGSTVTDYGYVFTESYAKPNGPNLIYTTFEGSMVYSYTNTERTVLVTAATTYSTNSISLPTGATSTSYSSYLPITSNTIPLASKFTDQQFTITIPSSISFTDSLASGTDISISGVEVVFETALGENGGVMSTSSERDTTIYAFSSLVTSIPKPVAAANTLSFNILHSVWWMLGLLCLI